MNLKEKKSNIHKLNNKHLLLELQKKFMPNKSPENIGFKIFELKEAIYRLEEYLFYSDENPFFDNVSYVKYSRFIFESYLNDVYIIQNRFRSLINSIKKDNAFTFTDNEIMDLENYFASSVNKIRKISKDIRGNHVHNKRYNDKDLLITDCMERFNKINMLFCNEPIMKYKGKDVYLEVTKSYLNDVQDIIIEYNNYLYDIIDELIKYIYNLIIK